MHNFGAMDGEGFSPEPREKTTFRLGRSNPYCKFKCLAKDD